MGMRLAATSVAKLKLVLSRTTPQALHGKQRSPFLEFKRKPVLYQSFRAR